MDVTRRQICAVPLLAAVAAKGGKPRLADDVRHFVDLGLHRVGTPGEKANARWLLGRLSGLGYQARVEPFPVRTVLDPGGSLSVGGHKVMVFPQWYLPEAALGKVLSGRLVALDAPGVEPAIRLVASPVLLTANWVEPLAALARAAAAKGAVALVMAVNDPSDDLFVCNQHDQSALPIPVALVARRDLAALAALLGQWAQVRLAGRMVETRALNVIGQKPGVGQAIVVSTPLTGWFRCGAERGPGIALWLRTAELLAKSPRPVMLIGSGSHEIGHLGMEYRLAHGAPNPDDVALWLHYGASIAATALDAQFGYKSGQYLVGTPESEAMAKAALQSVMPSYVSGTSKTLGEAGQILGAGHKRFVGLSGQCPTFHTPHDLGQAIDYAKLERVAAGAAALIATVG